MADEAGFIGIVSQGVNDRGEPGRRLRPDSIAGFVSSAVARLGDTLALEGERKVLWVPVAFGLGIALYFQAPVEPPFWMALVPAALAGLVMLAEWRTKGTATGLLASALIVMIGLGFGWADLRTHRVAAPVLGTTLSYALVTGSMASLDHRADGARAILERLTIEELSPASTPARIRVRFRGEAVPPLGARVRFHARLSPPPPPAYPGAYDFARLAWFERIGGVGFSLGPTTVLEPGRADWIERTRHALRARIAAALADADPGTRGLAIALVTGMRGDIPPDDTEAMRTAGLAHLLAISGLHLGLVAGFVFFVVRGGLALVPPLALRLPTRKIAALVALVAAGCYLLLAGATVPTQRAFVMLALGIMAILTDRLDITMRPVALAALIVLAVAPESILGASFQLSFAAVVALVAFYEAIADRRRRDPGRVRNRSPLARIARYAIGIALTTVVATAATSPLALFHFDRAATYGLAANLTAVPVVGMLVMPAGFLAALAMPFGAESLPLWAMAQGLDLVLAIARTISGWPGALFEVAAMPSVALPLIAVGGLWLAIWRTRWRFAGLVGIVAGLLTIPLATKPDVIVSGDGDRLAVRAGDGTYWIRPRVPGYERDLWLRRVGGADVRAWPAGAEDAAPGHRLACDRLGCVATLPSGSIALPADGRALDDDCRRASVIVSRVPVRGWRRTKTCSGARAIVDRIDLWRMGAHTVRLTAGGVEIESVAGKRGRRPWSGKTETGEKDGQ